MPWKDWDWQSWTQLSHSISSRIPQTLSSRTTIGKYYHLFPKSCFFLAVVVQSSSSSPAAHKSSNWATPCCLLTHFSQLRVIEQVQKSCNHVNQNANYKTYHQSPDRTLRDKSTSGQSIPGKIDENMIRLIANHTNDFCCAKGYHITQERRI